MVFVCEIWYTVKNSFGFNMGCIQPLKRGADAVLNAKVGILAVSLEVTMFGGFVLRHNGNTLKLERNNVTRSMQVLQMLLFHGEEGVPKDADGSAVWL